MKHTRMRKSRGKPKALLRLMPTQQCKKHKEVVSRKTYERQKIPYRSAARKEI